MAKGKQRLLQDLYHVTDTLSQPKITPILRGNCLMQGPRNESDCDIHTNMMPSQVEKEYSSCSKNLKSYKRLEAGTCSVCSAPCSSCLHINQHQMGSKVDEYSGDASSENAFSFSVTDAIPVSKIVDSETVQKSQTRNFVSGSSSNTCENVDCEASFRNSELSATSEIVIVFPEVDDFMGQEDHNDNQSCVIEVADSKLSDSSLRNGDNTDFSSFPVPANNLIAQENVMTLKKLPFSISTPADLSSQNSGLAETPSDTVGDATYMVKAQGNLLHPALDKSPSSGPSPDVLGENIYPRFHDGLLKYPSRHVSSLLIKEVTSGNVHIHADVDAVDFVEKNHGSDKVVAYECLPDAKGKFSESHPMGESDDSDLVEHDVKVCDICGDAGREDLLAICCRCSDGAEHTYCMREMVDKVPIGDWLCEECKFDVEMKIQNQEKVCTVDESEKINSSGQANPESLNVYKKFEAKGSDVEENRTNNDHSSVKILGKRLLDDAEVFCPTKRRVLDPNIGSAKMSTSSGIHATSRDSSFRLDRWKAKINQHPSSGSSSAPESSSSPPASRLQTPQGTFVKSNSFNALNMKPKVKLVDGVVPQKQRSVRESASLDRKDGTCRSISKSVSFKLPNMGRLNIGESKVKMLSPKFSHIQETKGSKHTKDRNIFERKNSFQLERLSASLPMTNSGSVAAKNDQKLVSSSEPNSIFSARKFRDAMTISTDSRSMLLSKSSSFSARRGSEPSVSQGEVKRQSSASLCGVSSTNEDSSHDLKPNQGSPKVNFSSSSSFADRPPCNANEDLQEGLSKQTESTNFGDRAKDSISSRSKLSNFGSRIVSCQKCKEIGHSAQSCTADNPGSLFDVTAAKNPRDGVDGRDKLKAAIEAAVLRKPGIYRKHRVSDQSNDVSVPNINYEVASQDQLSDSTNRENVSTSEEMQEGQMVLGNSNTEFCKEETVDDNGKQFPIISCEASSSRTGESCPFTPLEGLSLVRDVSSRVSEGASTLFKRLAIPDNEYIWQGVFEVQRIGRTINLFDGMQAHLSACASPKVLEAVNKFAHKILLNEVPRLTMWPVQFQENGVKEDNIAIFFFAKDFTSYEKSYKGLLDNMMKNDVALKGKFDGFDLMIFPSNQLPEKSQRWNTLFFMWGVFRGKRDSCSQNVPGSCKHSFVPQVIPTAIMSLPMNTCSVMPIYKGVSAGSTRTLSSEVRASELLCLSSPEALKEGCDSRVYSDIKNNDPVQTEQPLEKRLNSSTFSVVQSIIAKSCGETADTSILCDKLRHTSTSLEGCVESEEKREPELDICAESTSRVGGFSESKRMPIDCNSRLSRQHSSHYCGESASDAHERGTMGNISEGNLLDKMNSRKYETSLKDGSMHESPLGTGNQMVKDEYTEVASDGTSQSKPGILAEDIAVQIVSTSEKNKSDHRGLHGGNDQTSSSIEGRPSQICGMASDSPLVHGDGGAFDGDDIREFKGSAEMYFFPVDPLPEEEDVELAGKFMPLKMSALEEQIPNLELALGAETKTSAQGIPPFLVGKEDQKIIGRLSSPEAATKAEEDDVSASLSLSLSFPFPNKEQTVKSLSKSEQRHVNRSMFLFGLEGQVENRRSTFHSGRNTAPHGCDRFI